MSTNMNKVLFKFCGVREKNDRIIRSDPVFYVRVDMTAMACIQGSEGGCFQRNPFVDESQFARQSAEFTLTEGINVRKAAFELEN